VVRYFKSLMLVCAAVLVLAGAAVAGPINEQSPNSFIVTLNCDNGDSFDAIVVGADWSPGHIIGEQGVFHVLAFPTFTGTVTDADGNVVDQFSDPARFRGQGNVPASATDVTTCSFEVEFHEGGFTLTVLGTVTGYITGAK
jgi:hypothetical protein